MSDTWSTLFNPESGYTDLAVDTPLSPLDGRYRAAVAPLANTLSEAALNRARVHVEVEWLIYLMDHAPNSSAFDTVADSAITLTRCGRWIITSSH
ncbi:MAG: hypothetical protein E6905_05865, partial [Actinomyces sp.]|nr:hypothetical protein [Actinomyces sp.]